MSSSRLQVGSKEVSIDTARKIVISYREALKAYQPGGPKPNVAKAKTLANHAISSMSPKESLSEEINALKKVIMEAKEATREAREAAEYLNSSRKRTSSFSDTDFLSKKFKPNTEVETSHHPIQLSAAQFKRIKNQRTRQFRPNASFCFGNRPVFDLKKVSDERKKQPGYISLDFVVSDDEDEDEQKVNPEDKVFTRPGKEKEGPKFSFAKTEALKEETPKFSFGGAPKDATDVTKETVKVDAPAQGFSFGASKETPKEVSNEQPKTFAFGSSETSKPEPSKTFSFGDSKDKTTDAPKTGFSFGSAPKETQSEASEPAFSFGSTLNKASQEPPKTGFSFGSALSETPKVDAPKVDAPKVDAPKPAFSFGAPQNGASGEASKEEPKPAFTFGATSNAPKETPKPAFTFGASNEAPKVDTQKPVFTFGASSETPSEAPKSIISFDSKPDEPTQTKKRSFNDSESNPKKISFGTKPSETSEKPSSSFSFGSKASGDNSKSTFVFGAKPSDSEAPASTQPKFTFGGDQSNKPKDTPAFTFGGSNTSEGAEKTQASTANPGAPTPFSFGDNKDKSSALNNGPKSAPAFTFGASSQTDKPASVFGSTNAAAPTGDKPNFNFGGSTGTSSTNRFQFGGEASKQTTPFTFGQPAANAPSGNASGTAFTFGNNAPNAPQPSVGNTGFSFGAGTNSSSAAPSSAFGFGANPQAGAMPSAFGQAPAAASGFGKTNPNPFGTQSRETTPGAPSSRTIALVKRKLNRR